MKAMKSCRRPISGTNAPAVCCLLWRALGAASPLIRRTHAIYWNALPQPSLRA
jgi:hypothetical protein